MISILAIADADGRVTPSILRQDTNSRVLHSANGFGHVLALADAVGRVYAEWDEAKHPRIPSGTLDGGKWTSAVGDDLEYEAKLDVLRQRALVDPQVIEAERRNRERGDIREDPGVRDVNGNYSSEAMRENGLIADSYIHQNAMPPVGEDPTITLMIGKPGAGKSALLNYLPEGILTRSVVINPDLIMTKLPGYEPVLSPSYHSRASDIVFQDLLPKAVIGRYNIVFDATGKNTSKMEGIAESLKSMGYKINVAWADTDSLTSATRVYNRFLRGDRYVPVSLATSAEYRTGPNRTYAVLKQKYADTWSHYDTTGKEPKLIPSDSGRHAAPFGKRVDEWFSRNLSEAGSGVQSRECEENVAEERAGALQRSVASTGGEGQVAFADWNEALHPRASAGTSAGGEFVGRFSDVGDETGQGVVKKGDSFVVFRLGSGHELINANAGNANAVALHLVRAQDPEGPQGPHGIGDMITAYRVTLAENPGRYVAFNARLPLTGSKDDAYVGRDQAGTGVAYSFLDGGHSTVHTLSSVPLSDVMVHLKQRYGHEDFDSAGGNIGAQAIRDVFRTRLALHAWDESKHPRNPKGQEGGGKFTSGDSSLRDWLKQIAGFRSNNRRVEGLAYSSNEEFILKNGQAFQASTSLPAGVRPRKLGLCFMNAFQLVDGRPDLIYVEGVASYKGIPMDHAWAVDSQNHVIDPTWAGQKDYLPAEHKYFGVKIPIEIVRKTIVARGKYGVLYNPEQGFPLLKTEFKKFGLKSYAIERPLYVSRQVENAEEIIAWAKSVGFTTTLPVEDMHVMVCYSKEPVDWLTLDHANETLEIPPEGVRTLAWDESKHPRNEDGEFISSWLVVPDWATPWANTLRKAATASSTVTSIPFPEWKGLTSERRRELIALGWRIDVDRQGKPMIGVSQRAREGMLRESMMRKRRNYADRTITNLGEDGAVVLCFDSQPLQARHQYFLDHGASWDYDVYHPHITLTYAAPEEKVRVLSETCDQIAGYATAAELDLSKIEPYTGRIVLGPEAFAESFTAYTHPDYKKGMLPREVESFLDKHIGRQGLGKYSLSQKITVLFGTPKTGWVEADVDEGVIKEHHLFSQYADQTPTTIIDYAQIKNDLDNLEAKFRTELREVLVQSRDAIMAQVRKGKVGTGSELNLPYTQDIQQVIGDALQRAMDRGEADASKEIGRAKKEYTVEGDGRLVTMNGRHVFIKDGETPEQMSVEGVLIYAKTPTFSPKAAIKWLREKIFWVADVLTGGLLEDIRLSIINGLKTGRPTDSIVTDIAQVYIPYLGDPAAVRGGELPTAARLETVVRTNITESYNQGRIATFVRPDMMPFLDGIRYSAVLDSRTTPVCRYLHERIFRPEDIQLTGLIPPNHFNCRSLVVPIIVGELSKPPDYKVDPKVYITDEEILHAQALADAKFLEQEDYLTANDDVHSDGPSADVEEDGIEHCDFASWDESKHPREPGGSGKGGEFTSSGIPGANGDVPPEAGTVPIPEGHVRLYHQTTEENLLSIAKNGLTIEYAKGIEGPRAVYAGETPFYGKVETTPTLEFHVPKNKWQPPFVLQDVPPENMIAVHLPWHRQARYIIEDVDGIKNTLAGKFDYLLKPRSGVGETVQEADDEFAKAVRYIKKKYAGNLSG